MSYTVAAHGVSVKGSSRLRASYVPRDAPGGSTAPGRNQPRLGFVTYPAAICFGLDLGPHRLSSHRTRCGVGRLRPKRPFGYSQHVGQPRPRIWIDVAAVLGLLDLIAGSPGSRG